MCRNFIGALVIAGFLVPGIAGAVTDKDFEAETTQNLINLCTVSASDPKHEEAIHFCHGYLVGAYQYHMAASQGQEGEKRLVCFPKSGVTRNQAVAMFVDWAKAHPQYMNEKPVETEFRFLINKWPCKK